MLKSYVVKRKSQFLFRKWKPLRTAFSATFVIRLLYTTERSRFDCHEEILTILLNGYRRFFSSG